MSKIFGNETEERKTRAKLFGNETRERETRAKIFGTETEGRTTRTKIFGTETEGRTTRTKKNEFPLSENPFFQIPQSSLRPSPKSSLPRVRNGEMINQSAAAAMIE